MTYTLGGTIQAGDITSITGNFSNTSYFPDAATATNKLSAIYGFGWGDRGYGQTAYNIAPVDNTTLVQAAQWSSIVNVMTDIASHQNVTLSGLPLPTAFVAGNPISALAFNWQAAVATLDSNRLNVNPSQVSPFTTMITDTRTTDWSTFIYSEVLIDFGSEDNARFFFNTGSTLQIKTAFTPSHGDAQSLSWQTLTSAVGNIIFGAHNASQTGAGGNIFGLGYYELTDNYQQIFTQYNTVSPYTMNYIEVRAKRDSVNGPLGNNGGNGRGVRLQIYFHDDYSGVPDLIEGTASVICGYVVAQSPIIITVPSALVVYTLAGGGGPTFFIFNDTISSTVYNYDLLTQAVASGYPTNSLLPLHANITVTGTGKIGSKSVNLPSLNINALPASSLVTLILQQNSIIAGKGGDGGPGNSWYGNTATMSGTQGGNAINLNYPITLTNYGILGGGGGGGGGSAASYSNQTYDDPGGNGGGGAGLDAGLGNTSVGPNSTYYGQNGSLLTGGAGGYPSPHGGSREWASGHNGGSGGSLGSIGGYGSGDYPFGYGGKPGLAVNNHSLINAGSLWGNVRGNSDFTPLGVSTSGTTQYDFINGSPGSITTVYNFAHSTTNQLPVTWSISPNTYGGISASLAVNADGSLASVTFTSSSTSVGTLVGYFTISVTAANGVVGVETFSISQTYVDTTPTYCPGYICYGGGAGQGSCFLAGSKVLMASGLYKNIEDIMPGEFVRGAFGEINPVLALDIVYLGNRFMYDINGDHMTSDDHPHVSVNRGFYSCEPDAIKSEWGNYFECELPDGEHVLMLNKGINKDRIKQMELGVVLQNNQGPRKVESIKQVIMAPETRLYNFVVGGSHTYTVDDYAVTGWPREEDFDYDLWQPKAKLLTLEDYLIDSRKL